MARLSRECTPKYTTSEDRDQLFTAHARINELKRLKRLKGKEADLFSQTSLSNLSLKLPKLDTYDYRRMGHIYVAGVYQNAMASIRLVCLKC